MKDNFSNLQVITNYLENLDKIQKFVAKITKLMFIYHLSINGTRLLWYSISSLSDLTSRVSTLI